MSHHIETMAYTNELPWHGLGFPVKSTLSPAQMLKAAKLDWKVEKRPLSFKGKKGLVEVPKRFGLIRATDDQFLSVCGPTYKPIQNADILDFFSKFVKAGKMNMETAGSLKDGKYIWALARLGKDFSLGKDDEVRGFLLACQPHVAGNAAVFQFTPIRVVCWNTLSWALGTRIGSGRLDTSTKGGANGAGGSRFSFIHSRAFDQNVRNAAEEALGLASGQMEQFQEAATVLSKKKATAAKVEDYFAEVLKWDPKKAKKKKDGDDKEPRILPKFRAALEHAPGANLASAAGTWWGALNAVTYVVDHETGRDQSSSLASAWLGRRAALKNRAVELALQKAK